MPFSSQKKIPSNNPPANGLASQSTQVTQQPHCRPYADRWQPVCIWSAHFPNFDPSPVPFPRFSHTLTATATAAGELFLFGGYVFGGYVNGTSNNLYAFSTRDFSLAILKTSGEVPTPRYAHGTALIGTTLLICGGETKAGESVPNYDSLYLFNLGTSDPLMSTPTPADHGFALQNCGSGPALWSMVPGRAVVAPIPQLWSVPSSSSSVVRLPGRSPMICGHSI
jgi:hypothetical protein